jgi:CheY-like chemotaxis protein
MTEALTTRNIYDGKRAVILRRLKRVDLKSCMESLEKHSRFAKNLFQASKVCITIIDESIIWVLAANGTNQRPMYLVERKNTLCDRIIDPDEADYYVIPNRLISSLPSLLDQQTDDYIFGACIPLIVEDARVGTLSIEDTKPRPEFESVYLSHFKDMAICIADVLQSQMHLSDQLILGWTSLMVGVTHNLRTPLSIVTLSVSEAMTQMSNLHNRHKAINSSDLLQSLDNCRDAEIAAQQLQLVIDANSNLGNLILSYESKISPRSMMTTLSRLATHGMISRVRKRLTIMEDNHSIQWFVNETSLGEKTHRTYSDAIEQSIASAIAQFMVQHAEISVYINFESPHNSSIAHIPNQEMLDPFSNEGYIVVEVTFQVETNNELQSESKSHSKLDGHRRYEPPTTLREFDTFSQRFELQLIERLLKVVGGRISKLSTADGRSGRLVMQFPCEVVPNDVAAAELMLESKGEPIEGEGRIVKLKEVLRGGDDHEYEGSHPATDGYRENYSLDSRYDVMQSGECSEMDRGNTSQASATTETTREDAIKALIIEDGIPVQKILSSWLKRKGCEVQTAINGKLGLEKLKHDTFEIVFCDFLMPVQDGVTTMRLYQQHLNHQDAIKMQAATQNSENDSLTATSGVIEMVKRPLIIGISATANKEDLEEAFSYGMNFFCQKPLAADVLDFLVLTYQEHHDDTENLGKAMEEKSAELTALGKPMAIVSQQSLQRILTG